MRRDRDGLLTSLGSCRKGKALDPPSNPRHQAPYPVVAAGSYWLLDDQGKRARVQHLIVQPRFLLFFGRVSNLCLHVAACRRH